MSLESIHVSIVNIGTRRVVCICENIRLPSSPFALHARLARRQPVSLNVGIRLTHQAPIPSMREWKTILGT